MVKMNKKGIGNLLLGLIIAIGIISVVLIFKYHLSWIVILLVLSAVVTLYTSAIGMIALGMGGLILTFLFLLMLIIEIFGG